MVADAVDRAPEVRRKSIITRARRARQVAPAVLRLNAAVRQRAARAHRLEQSSFRGLREEARRDDEPLYAAVVADHLDPRALRRRRPWRRQGPLALRRGGPLALARTLVVAVPREVDGVRGDPPTRSSCVAVFDARRAVLLALRRRGEAALVVRVRIKNFDDALACRCGGRRGRRVVVAIPYRYQFAPARRELVRAPEPLQALQAPTGHHRRDERFSQRGALAGEHCRPYFKRVAGSSGGATACDPVACLLVS